MRARLLMTLMVLSTTAGCKTTLPESDVFADADGDGYTPADGDCDDADAKVSPGADEICDGLDNDCDDVVDSDAIDQTVYYQDADEDGFGASGSASLSCSSPGDLWIEASGDCDDANAEIYPGAEEVCDLADNDCDDFIDEDPPTWWLDSDGDGVGTSETELNSCDQDVKYVSADNGDDCDDGDATSYPGADELCDDVDHNCDGDNELDAIDAVVVFTDGDGDGFGDDTTQTAACEADKGTVEVGGDCDDGVNDVYPGAPEYCDGVDHDCDKLVNESESVDALTVYTDADGDSYGDPKAVVNECSLSKGNVKNSDDCDDTTASAYPGAPEACDGFDWDCDGDGYDAEAVDAVTYYYDGDGDGYGDATVSEVACLPSTDFVADSTDCDDGADDIYPGAPEYCGGVDHDCDKLVDEEDSVDALGIYEDSDSDDYGDPATEFFSCAELESGQIDNGDDCDDGNPDIYPDAPEQCDGVDYDCDLDGYDPESVDAVTYYHDGDSDGYGDLFDSLSSCFAETDYIVDATDCDDSSDLANPGILDETCNDWLDNNCDDGAPECVLVDMDLSGADVVYQGAGSFDYAGSAIIGGLDLDSDGDVEFLTGSPNYGAGGAVYLLGMSAPAAASVDLSTTYDAIITGSGGESLGAALSGGDMDGDGADEVVVGAPDYGAAQGAVYLFDGPLSGSLTTADAVVSLVSSVPAENFATAVAVGDVAGGSAADLIVGAPGDLAGPGTTYLFIDPLIDCTACTDETDASSSFVGETDGDMAGFAVAVVGDVNCDGIADIGIGAPNHDSGIGAAYLFTDADLSEYDAKFGGTAALAEEFGYSLAPFGDVNDDGCSDFAIGGPGGVVSSVIVMQGANDLSFAEMVLVGSNDRTGTAIASVGDHDGDGLGDVAVGNGDGVVNVIYASSLSESIDANDDADIVFNVGSAALAVTGAADQNNDGYPDLLFGAPSVDTPSTDQGAAYLVYGLGL